MTIIPRELPNERLVFKAGVILTRISSFPGLLLRLETQMERNDTDDH